VSARPLCSDQSRERGEDIGATASRVERWVLVEYAGHWPSDPLDAAPFAGRLRELLAAQLRALPRSRLVLVKRPPRHRDARIRVIVGTTPERGASFGEVVVERYSHLLDLDLAALFAGEAATAPVRHPLLLVCTHGKRDRCCARYGQPVCEALHRTAPPSWLWQASHVGGDRFAGNVVALPEGIYLGRVTPDDVPGLLASYRQGRIPLDLYRGRSCYPFPIQAAEIRIRRDLGLDGFWDLAFVDAERPGGDEWRVRFRTEVSGEVHEVDVVRQLGEPALTTCAAREPRPVRRFVAQARRLVEPVLPD
jgi:hypothetical protein